MASVLSEVAAETRGRAIVGLIMISERDLAAAFRIRSIPTIFVVKNAEIIATFVGFVPKTHIQKTLRDAGA
jgi:thioredoxin-like negative regulator of GroEL